MGFEPTIPFWGRRFSSLRARSHAQHTRTQTPFCPASLIHRIPRELQGIDRDCNSGATVPASSVRASDCGIDVEDLVLTNARALVARHGLSDRIGLVKVAPGPLSFPPATFDVVFSKEAIVHIPDKHDLMREVRGAIGL